MKFLQVAQQLLKAAWRSLPIHRDNDALTTVSSSLLHWCCANHDNTENVRRGRWKVLTAVPQLGAGACRNVGCTQVTGVFHHVMLDFLFSSELDAEHLYTTKANFFQFFLFDPFHCGFSVCPEAYYVINPHSLSFPWCTFFSFCDFLFSCLFPRMPLENNQNKHKPAAISCCTTPITLWRHEGEFSSCISFLKECSGRMVEAFCTFFQFKHRCQTPWI